MHSSDDIYLSRCAQLAIKAGTSTKTNPWVGAVLVAHGDIIGEGYHECFGGPHAEINAFNSVREEQKHLIPQAILYVSLEPCSHYGKTPPCAHKIVEMGIKRVVLAVIDPNPQVAGRGVEYLKSHGVQVDVIFNEACTKLLDRFLVHLEKMPFVTLKWAQSSDFYISARNHKTAISQEHTQILVHKWRSEHDAILVGKNTVLIDNPILDVRYYGGKCPIRVILDTKLEIPETFNVYQGEIPTLILNEIKTESHGHLDYIKVSDMRDVSQLLKLLFERGIYSVLVEGGAEAHKAFISSNLWHQACIITNKQKLGDGVKAASVSGRLDDTLILDKDTVHIIKNIA